MYAECLEGVSYGSAFSAKLPTHHVNGDLLLARIVLQPSCKEGLHEEEARQPEERRGAVLVPAAQHGQSPAWVHGCMGKRGVRVYLRKSRVFRLFTALHLP